METVSDVFKQLQRTLGTAQQKGDFPDWLAADIQTILSQSEKYSDQKVLISTLAAQIGDYDPFAGCGCFSDSCGISDLERTLKQLKS